MSFQVNQGNQKIFYKEDMDNTNFKFGYRYNEKLFIYLSYFNCCWKQAQYCISSIFYLLQMYINT